jgi:hypothetical protein
MRTHTLALLFVLVSAGGLGWTTPARAAPTPPPAEPRPATEGQPPARGQADPATPAPGAGAPGERPAPADRPPGDPGQDPSQTPEQMTPKVKKPKLSHRFQGSVDVAVGVGYSLIVTYRDTTWCGTRESDGDNASFCSGLYPVFLDIGFAFGVMHQLDVLAEFRVGTFGDLVGNLPLAFMPGIRVWIDPEEHFKIGIAFQLVVDFTRQTNDDQDLYGRPIKGESADVGGRIYAQFQYDFLRYVGIFARLGAMCTARRWVQVNLAVQLGVQARFP